MYIIIEELFRKGCNMDHRAYGPFTSYGAAENYIVKLNTIDYNKDNFYDIDHYIVPLIVTHEDNNIT